MPTIPLIKGRIKSGLGVPYGGIYLLDLPEKGMVGSGTDFGMLLDRIREWRRANGVPIGLGFEEEVEREICPRYPDMCYETDVRVPKLGGRLGLGDIVSGTKNLLRFKIAGSPLVSQEEANRRAAICAKCPWNTDFQMPCGGGCGALKGLAQQFIGNQTTPYDNNLKSCSICHCYNSVAVWLPVGIQWQTLNDEQKLQFEFAAESSMGCWKIPA
jgi:hypothetical protein